MKAVPVNPSKTRRLAVSLTHEMADRVERLARDDRRSVSQWMAFTIETAVVAAERMRAKRFAEEDAQAALADQETENLLTPENLALLKEVIEQKKKKPKG